MNFAARAEGESKLDRTVIFEFLVGLYDKWLGRIIPTRFALFGTVGAMGAVVHMTVLALVLHLFGAKFAVSSYPKEMAFIVGQTAAAFTAMTFNFVLNNEITYRSYRYRGLGMIGGFLLFAVVCSIGAISNVNIASWLFAGRTTWWLAGLAGALVGVVWNYAASTTFVWRGRRKS